MSDFEDAAYVDGASDMDKCIQVKFFLSDNDTKTVVESMEGYRRKNWFLLKSNMMELWGAGMIPLYTLDDLDSLCDKLKNAGGIKSYDVYVKFQSKFRIMLQHLYSSGQIVRGDFKIIANKYFRVFSPSIQKKARDVLLADGDMLSERRIIRMPSLIVLERVFKKVMATMNAWEAMAFDDGIMEVAEERQGSGSVITHFQTRKQINMGAKVVNLISQAEMKELRRKMVALTKENEARKARIPPAGQFGEGYQKAYDNNQEATDDSSSAGIVLSDGTENSFHTSEPFRAVVMDGSLEKSEEISMGKKT